MQRLDWFTHKIEAIQYNFTSRWLPKSSKSGTSPQLFNKGFFKDTKRVHDGSISY